MTYSLTDFTVIYEYEDSVKSHLRIIVDCSII